MTRGLACISSHSMCIVAVILLVLLGSYSVECIKAHDTIEGKIRYRRINYFGFLKGGSIDQMDINIEPSNTDLWFLMCTLSEFDKMFGFAAADICREGITEKTCSLSVPFNGTLSLHNRTVTKRGTYQLLLIHCHPEYVTGTVDYILLNPGGEHLSSGVIPVPALFTVFLIIWILLTGAWCFNWIVNRTQRVKLHRVISVYPITKFIYCAYELYYWTKWSKVGTLSFADYFFDWFTTVLFRLVFFFLLLLIASGWGITKDTIDREKRYIGGIIVGLAITLTAGFLLNGMFLMLTFIIYIATMILIFKYANENLQLLEREMAQNDRDPNMREPDGSREKHKMFKKFKVIMSSYIVGIMVVVLLSVLFLFYYYWTVVMLYELLELLMFICIAFSFRLRKVNIYYRMNNEQSESESFELADQQQES